MSGNEEELTGSGRRERMREKIAQRCANMLGQLASRLSRWQLYLLLWVFIAAGSAGCLYLLLVAVTGAPARQSYAVELPAQDKGQTVKVALKERDRLLIGIAYRRLQEAKRALDSLGRTEQGREKIREIFLRRPGLADSMRMCEEFLRTRMRELE